MKRDDMKDIHTGKLFSTGMKMAEVPDAEPRLLGVMRRLGIRFGFGEKPLRKSVPKMVSIPIPCY